MNKLRLLSILAVALIAATMMSSSAYAFDPTQVNMTLNDVQTTSFPEFDVLTVFFSLFNNNTEPVSLSGYNMLYLNDTNANYWELSNDIHIDGISNTCPTLDSTIPSGQSGNLQLCYVIPKANDVGYSLVLNNDRFMMDLEIKEYVLESVPSWFTATANSWCTDVSTDSEYINSVQFMIEQGNIDVLRGISGTDLGSPIPSWVKTNACDWSNGLISEYEYLDGVYWLIDNGKIQL